MSQRKHSRSFDLLSGFDGYRPDVGGIFILLALLLAGAAIGVAVQFFLQKYLSAEAAASYGILIVYPLQFLPPMMYAAIKSMPGIVNGDTTPLDKGRFKPVGAFFLAVMLAVGTVALAVASEPVVAILPEMPETLKEAMKQLTGGPLWVALLSTAVFAPFFEEWLCRGMVLRGMLQKVSPVWAIIISAAFFAVIHLNPWQAIPAFILGCLFGLVYYKTGSLKLTMMMHCINNAFSVFLSRIPRFADNDYMWQCFDDVRIYGLLYATCLALIVLLVTRLIKTDFTA